jgi:hypothetical protein
MPATIEAGAKSVSRYLWGFYVKIALKRYIYICVFRTQFFSLRVALIDSKLLMVVAPLSDTKYLLRSILV